MTYENFTTYTEVDPNNHITVSANRASRTAWQNEDAYLYKDYGLGHFTDFSHQVEVQFQSGANNRTNTYWQLANAVDDFVGLLNNAAEDYLAVYAVNAAGTPTLVLVECKGLNGTNTSSAAIAWNTTYYLTIKKVGTALSCEIYTDSNRTTLHATLSITLVDNSYAFRYVYVANSWNNGTAQTATGFCQNLELNEGASVSTTSSGIWPREVYISGYTPRYQKRQIVGYHAQSGDLRSIEVDASGHLFTDVSLHISGLDIQVNISGDPVIISGQPVTISGNHIYLESGPYTPEARIYGYDYGNTTWKKVAICSGGDFHICSGLNVVIESGIGVQATVVTDVSGQPIHVGCAATIRTGKLLGLEGGMSGHTLSGVGTGSGGISFCSGDFCSGPIHSIIIKNIADNDPVYIGEVNCKPYSGYGFLLAESEAINLDYCNICNIYGWAKTSGQFITWIATDY